MADIQFQAELTTNNHVDRLQAVVIDNRYYVQRLLKNDKTIVLLDGGRMLAARAITETVLRDHIGISKILVSWPDNLKQNIKPKPQPQRYMIIKRLGNEYHLCLVGNNNELGQVVTDPFVSHLELALFDVVMAVPETHRILAKVGQIKQF